MKPDKGSENISDASDIAIAALSFLAQDSERLERFLALSGIDPGTIRRAAADPGFLEGILDHVAADERLLLDFAAQAGLRPDDVARARQTLGGPAA